jgi:uncharacterized protein YprB with RNaseH-like and TPR domain
MRYSENMSDIDKKLDGLRAQLGLVSGRDIAPKPKEALLKQPESIPPSEEKNGRVLSDALAAQLRARFLLNAAAVPEEPHADDGETIEIDSLLPGSVVGEEHSAFFLLRKQYALDFTIGDVPLGDALASCGREIALSACDDALLAFDPRKTCFMDTETTGLAGGAGTVAFLVGVGYFQEETFVLEQCFLRDYDDEEAMLGYLSEKLATFSTVVSYNGKSFDLPLMRSRFVQHRLKFPLDAVSHYDLVHAARRVWKKRLNNCALNNIEKEVLGLHRHGDVPGYLIPHLWMQYLETRDARPLEPVFYHHEMDILSLVALTGYLSKRLATDNDTSFHHAEDRLAVVKLYVKNKEYESAIREARQFLEVSKVTDDLRRECLALLGQSCKRAGLFEEMAQAWMVMHEEFPEDAQAASELAKYREHQERDFQNAIQICRETLAVIQKKAIPLDFEISALRGRLARLEKKQDKLHKKHSVDSEIFSSDI